MNKTGQGERILHTQSKFQTFIRLQEEIDFRENDVAVSSEVQFSLSYFPQFYWMQ